MMNKATFFGVLPHMKYPQIDEMEHPYEGIIDVVLICRECDMYILRRLSFQHDFVFYEPYKAVVLSSTRYSSKKRRSDFVSKYKRWLAEWEIME